jgi:apolipoprotein N-acyltransferase
MKKLHPSILSALTGLLLYAAWPESPLTGLIFIAFIPLLWIDRQGIRRARFFGWTYLSMLIWNLCTTWWVLNSTIPGGIGAILANSLLMCVPWILFHWIRQRMGNSFGYLSLVVFWLSFEYFHLQNWGLSWPWLTLGNVFATHPQWIQWYEFTGTSGGGLWILIANILLFQWLWQLTQHRSVHRPILIGAILLIALPILLSPFLNTPIPNSLSAAVPLPNPTSPATSTTDKIHVPNIVLVQPNIDPYEKVAAGTFDTQLARLTRLSDSAIDSNTVLLIWPETALFDEENGGIEEDHMKELHFLGPLWVFLKNHPRLNLLTGIESFRLFNDRHSPTAFPNSGENNYVERYNSAAILDSSGLLQVYHKSRLVPGVETLPSSCTLSIPGLKNSAAPPKAIPASPIAHR